jgi:hypothetical protein
MFEISPHLGCDSKRPNPLPDGGEGEGEGAKMLETNSQTLSCKNFLIFT